MLSKNKKLFQKLKELKLPLKEYAVFGSGPMGIRDLREINDIDIIITEKIFNEYLDKPEWKIRNVYKNNECFRRLINNNNIEMWRDWYTNWDVEKMIQEAEIIDNIPFVRLNYVVKWKNFLSREKDIEDVKLIEKFLSTK
jgi:hypothetical protein